MLLHRRRIIIGFAGLLCCWLTSCGAKPSRPSSPATSAELKPAELIVSAAASTKDVIELLAAKFSESGKANIKINPGPSSGLANQILAGAPADLFLSVNRKWADELQAADLAESSQALLTNKLVIIVPKGNPANVQTPSDLESPQVLKIALAGEQVPAGQYADQALGKLGLLEPLTSAGKIARGQDVRSALSYVDRGEAEAGIVYSTDAKVADNVEVVHEFDPALHDEIVYVLVLLKHGAEKPAARKFFEFLQSADADAAWEQAGFQRLRGE